MKTNESQIIDIAAYVQSKGEENWIENERKNYGESKMVDVGFLDFQNRRLRCQKYTKNLAKLKDLIRSLGKVNFMQKADTKSPHCSFLGEGKIWTYFVFIELLFVGI